MLGGAPRFGLRDRLRHQFAEAGFESAGPNERSGIETLLADVEPEPSRPPNGSRLSCGAELKCSQTEVYYTAFEYVHRMP